MMTRLGITALAEDEYYSIYQSEKREIFQNSIDQALESGINEDHTEKLQESYQELLDYACKKHTYKEQQKCSSDDSSSGYLRGSDYYRKGGAADLPGTGCFNR